MRFSIRKIRYVYERAATRWDGRKLQKLRQIDGERRNLKNRERARDSDKETV